MAKYLNNLSLFERLRRMAPKLQERVERRSKDIAYDDKAYNETRDAILTRNRYAPYTIRNRATGERFGGWTDDGNPRWICPNAFENGSGPKVYVGGANRETYDDMEKLVGVKFTDTDFDDWVKLLKKNRLEITDR